MMESLNSGENAKIFKETTQPITVQGGGVYAEVFSFGKWTGPGVVGSSTDCPSSKI
jgi:hypothetical protein